MPIVELVITGLTSAKIVYAADLVRVPTTTPLFNVCNVMVAVALVCVGSAASKLLWCEGLKARLVLPEVRVGIVHDPIVFEFTTSENLCVNVVDFTSAVTEIDSDDELNADIAVNSVALGIVVSVSDKLSVTVPTPLLVTPVNATDASSVFVPSEL